MLLQTEIMDRELIKGTNRVVGDIMNTIPVKRKKTKDPVNPERPKNNYMQDIQDKRIRNKRKLQNLGLQEKTPPSKLHTSRQ